MEKSKEVICGEIISRAWEDEVFKKRFLASPKDVLKEAGIPTEEGVDYKVVEAPKLVQYMVLPYENQQEALQQIAKLLLAKADRDTPVLPEGTEMRIIQNTDSVRYLILPSSPKTLTAAELKLVSGGDGVSSMVDLEISTAPAPNFLVGAVEIAVVVAGVVVLV